MPDGDSTTDKNLYRRSGSPCWWVEVVVDGQRLRTSTRCRTIEAARSFRDRYIESLRASYVSHQWRTAVLADSKNPRGWVRTTYSRIRARSRRKDFGALMTYDELVSLLLSCNGACAVTGLPLILDLAAKHNPWRASLDRIECDKGYERNNCRIVCMILNISMNSWGLDALRALARAMVGRELSVTPMPTVAIQPSEITAPRRRYRHRKQ